MTQKCENKSNSAAPMYTPILSITLKDLSETFQLHPCTSVNPKYKTYLSIFQYISTMVTKRPIQSPSGLQSTVLHTAPGSCSTQPESSPSPPSLPCLSFMTRVWEGKMESVCLMPRGQLVRPSTKCNEHPGSLSTFLPQPRSI